MFDMFWLKPIVFLIILKWAKAHFYWYIR